MIQGPLFVVFGFNLVIQDSGLWVLALGIHLGKHGRMSFVNNHSNVFRHNALMGTVGVGRDCDCKPVTGAGCTPSRVQQAHA